MNIKPISNKLAWTLNTTHRNILITVYMFLNQIAEILSSGYLRLFPLDSDCICKWYRRRNLLAVTLSVFTLSLVVTSLVSLVWLYSFVRREWNLNGIVNHLQRHKTEICWFYASNWMSKQVLSNTSKRLKECRSKWFDSLYIQNINVSFNFFLN
jgi:hypothetical protein